MTGPTRFSGPSKCVADIVRNQGLRGLYRGLVPQAWRDGPGFGAYMVVYEAGLAGMGGREKTGKWEHFISGGVAGVVCWLATLPFDVIKSRMQADSLERPQYKGMLDCTRKSYQEGGIKLFTRGWLAVSLRAFPVNAVTFLIYELLLDSCNQFNR